MFYSNLLSKGWWMVQHKR